MIRSCMFSGRNRGSPQFKIDQNRMHVFFRGAACGESCHESLKMKLLLVFVLLSFIVSLLVGGMNYLNTQKNIDKNLKDSLSHAANFVEHTLPYDSFAAYVKAIKESDPVAAKYGNTWATTPWTQESPSFIWSQRVEPPYRP